MPWFSLVCCRHLKLTKPGAFAEVWSITGHDTAGHTLYTLVVKSQLRDWACTTRKRWSQFEQFQVRAPRPPAHYNHAPARANVPGTMALPAAHARALWLGMRGGRAPGIGAGCR